MIINIKEYRTRLILTVYKVQSVRQAIQRIVESEHCAANGDASQPLDLHPIRCGLSLGCPRLDSPRLLNGTPKQQ